MDMPTLGGLRYVKEEDLELMRTWRNASPVREKMYTRHEISFEEHRKWWATVKTSTDKRYFIYELAAVPMGVVAFTNIDPRNEQALWAFYASPEAPKGTGSRMEFLALDYAFDVLKVHKLSCEVLGTNAPVVKLHKKFGFTVEGVFRQHHKMVDQFIDIFRLGLLASEWTSLRPNMMHRLTKSGATA
jgi:UDP-4-amino-4,6-dideoxy-N-acetyl-beta-L-altrosamine N-acetyltransferase